MDITGTFGHQSRQTEWNCFCGIDNNFYYKKLILKSFLFRHSSSSQCIFCIYVNTCHRYNQFGVLLVFGFTKHQLLLFETVRLPRNLNLVESMTNCAEFPYRIQVRLVSRWKKMERWFSSLMKQTTRKIGKPTCLLFIILHLYLTKCTSLSNVWS